MTRPLTGYDTDDAEWQQFVKWLQEDSGSLFWITGNPDSGKSTFIKFIQDDERTLQALETWRDTPTIISHYLWKTGGSPNQHNLRGLLCSLLYQVLLNDRHLAIQLLRDSLALSAKDDETDWSVDELKALLFKGLRSTPRSYFVLLDGLDEVERHPGSIGQLLDLVHGLLAENQVKFCVSSCAERPFELGFNHTPHTSWRMQDLTRDDISEYTHDFLRTVGLDSEDLLDEISRTILRKAEGVFLWVYLVLANIKLGINHYDEDWVGIQERIGILPQDLMELYRDMLSRLDGHREVHIAQAARLFSISRLLNAPDNPLWFDCTIVRLTIASNDQFLERFSTANELPNMRELALACSHTLKTLPSVCAGLLEADTGYNSDSADSHEDMTEQGLFSNSVHVGFTHRTAMDFLDSDEAQTMFRSRTPKFEDTVSDCLTSSIIEQLLSNDRNYRFPQLGILSRYRGQLQISQQHHLLSLVHRNAAELMHSWLFSSQPNISIFDVAQEGFLSYVDGYIDSVETGKPSAELIH
ncbi:hypothetical protein CMUS01_03432 [Colletotrichum musicola]|uniref:NACHT domain-containing protein n=1 Tax=Colletotrichum musicola TaxID=2175873 RepID=A0A8H6U5W2_9PEZI|nr:hypothetical protein CMUS01_03432 [Colletotrichum musicola]